MPDINISSIVGQQRSYNSGTTANRPANPISGELYYDTTIGGLMVYNGVSWSTFLTPASVLAPTTPVATNVGTNRDLNNGSASISFTTSSELGGSAALYTVVSTPGSYTQTGTSSPILVEGLQSNTSYTFTVKASNSYSNATSVSTASITATTLPGQPTLGTAVDVGTSGQVDIPVTVNNGGSAITNYKWSTDNITYNTLSPAQTGSTVRISGLTNNQSYQFYIKAVNANGDSPASAISNSVTPTASYVLVETFNTSGTYTVPAGTTRMAVYTFSGGGGGGNSRSTTGAIGGRGGYAASLILNSVTPGTTYNVTVGAAGAGAGYGWGVDGGAGGASNFGGILNSGSVNNSASSNIAGHVVGNAQGAAGGNFGANGGIHEAGAAGGAGGAGGNLVMSGPGLTSPFAYGGGGGGGGGGKCCGTGNAYPGPYAGGAGGSPYGGAGGSGQGYTNTAKGANQATIAGSGAVGTVPGGGGGAGGITAAGDEWRGFGASGAAGRVIVYTRQ